MAPKKQLALIVCDSHKQIIFGFAPSTELKDRAIRLTDAQMCINYRNGKGTFGLASSGPDQYCKVTQAIPAVTIQDVIGVLECSEEAIKAWQSMR